MDFRQSPSPKTMQEFRSSRLPCTPDGMLRSVSHEEAPSTCDSKRGNGCTPLRKPKHPLNAYNLFFRTERAKLLGIEEDAANTLRRQRAHKKTHGKISFSDLGKMIGKKWKELDSVTRAMYQAEAKTNSKRYKEEMAVYKQAVAARAEAERKESCKSRVVMLDPTPRPAKHPATREQHNNVLQWAFDLAGGACSSTTWLNKSSLKPNLDPKDLNDGGIYDDGDDITDDEVIDFLQGLLPMEKGDGNPVTSSFHGFNENVGPTNHVTSADVTGASHTGSWDDPFPFMGIAPSGENRQPRFSFELEDYNFGMDCQGRKRAKLPS